MSGEAESTRTAQRRPTGVAVFLVIAGAIGLFAAFRLTLDKIAVLSDPHTVLDCNISPLVTCGKNLASWQGSLFGFPNPILGLICWTLVIGVGVALLAGARFARWYWILFTIGTLGGITLVGWLISQSVFVLGTLCPWCMVTWSVMIPTFIVVTLHGMRTGAIPLAGRGQATAAAAFRWVVPMTIVVYAVVAAIAQVRLDWIHTAF
ncbi:MAG TPA: vitamin K epoxide reductase family protein [Pseudolysinimonas sp.]|nr:vitamin K epoxide reductase family protein [Pseudolysinimonas sp.]